MRTYRQRPGLLLGAMLTCAALTTASPSLADVWGSAERKNVPPPDLGPSGADAPLPPTTPYAPGEEALLEEKDSHAEKDPPPEDRPPAALGAPGKGGPPAKAAQPRPQAPIASDAERTPPDYDGVDTGTSAGEVLLWVPRIALSPLYLVSEFVVRRPLGWVATTAEREHWPAILIDFFTFGPQKNAGIVPTFLIDFGFRPSGGLFFFWDDVLTETHDIRLRAATGGPDWWLLNAISRFEPWRDQTLYVRGEVNIRPDSVFHGLGPESGEDRFRFRRTLFEGELGYVADLWRSSTFTSFVGIRDVNFDSDIGCCGNPTVAQGVARGVFPLPPGMVSGYTVLRHGIVAEFDTREQRYPDRPMPGTDFVSPSGSGIRLSLRGAHSAAINERSDAPAGGPNRYHFVNYGATLGGFVDILERQRVLGLELIADFADPVQENGEVPFTEQAMLGGERPLRGFLRGRLVDRSAIAARFTYSWPVWVWLDGVLHYSVGNVFGEHLSGFEPALLRSSFGLGLRATTARDHAFGALIAAGTDTFRGGSEIERLRFVVGTTSGF